MKIYDFSYDYSKLIDLPESNSEKIWQRYFAQLNDIFKRNESVFINQRTSAFDAKKIKQVNQKYKKLLNEEHILLLKAEEKYFRLFEKAYRDHRQIRNDKIQKLLPYLDRIDYFTLGMMGSYTSSLIVMEQSVIILEKKFRSDYQMIDQITKSDLINRLLNLDLGYWSKEYVSRYAMVCDGETWNLKFTFIKGKRCKELNFYGDNCFPHNFDEFESLFLHNK